MNPEQWQQIKTVFHAARALPERERAAYLNEACAGNEALRAEVAALLDFDEDTNDFMQQPALAETRFGSLLKENEDLPTGQRIGPYEIQSKIGEGGMGQVYRARDSRLGRAVAIKVLRADLTRDVERVRRFQQEARAASALNHPNILTIYEVDREDGRDFIATEFIEGQTLRAILKAGGLTIGEILEVVTQVGKALETAHRAGIIHRDIKPENLMRRADGYVKVLDFGLAKLTEDHQRLLSVENAFSHFTTRPGVVMGTVTYMSPEQARGLDVDARTDIFSLGVVLYEMLTGRVPFDGDTASDVIAALLEREPQPLDSHISGLPETFQQIIHRALAKPLEQRYATMSEMLANLHTLKDDLEITAKLKRSGKTKAADASLLERRVGQSQGEAARSTKERRGRTTSTMQEVAAWFSRFAPSSKLTAVIASALIVSFAVLAGVTSWQWMKERGTSTALIDSVAVLPFADNTNDAQLNYLPDGLTESLINNLSRLPNLRVMASGSVQPYKTRAATPQQVGSELKVSAVVSGRIQKAGDKLLINVEMANARDGSRLWGERYERPLSDLLKTQNEIVREITQQMRGRLSGASEQQLARHQPANNEAYRLYLLGLYHANKQSQQDGLTALGYYQQAIDLDPAYALAYTGIADIYAYFSSRYLAPQEAMPKARQAALKALALDGSLAEAHHSLALVKLWGDWDWQGAEQEFKQALALNPNLAITHALYANSLSFQRRFPEFRREIQTAQQLDPLSAHVIEISVWGLYFERSYDEALAESQKLLALDSHYLRVHAYRGFVYRQKGQLREAIAEVEKSLAEERRDSLLSDLAYLYAVAGQTEKASQLLAELEQKVSQRQSNPFFLAKIHIGLGEPERAFTRLQETYAAHSESLFSLSVDPIYDPIRHDPRFIEILRGVGLPQ